MYWKTVVMSASSGVCNSTGWITDFKRISSGICQAEAAVALLQGDEAEEFTNSRKGEREEKELSGRKEEENMGGGIDIRSPSFTGIAVLRSVGCSGSTSTSSRSSKQHSEFRDCLCHRLKRL